MKLQKAQRHQVKLRIGLSGASGFGKTTSALLIANGITNDWSKIAVIDTENNSANLYSDLGEFNTIQLNPPYNPEQYIKAINICEEAGMEVIIIDSISHEWSGKGGCLQLHEQLGGRFQDWAKITPRHQSFIDAILQSKAHIITTVRRKVEYDLERSNTGKLKVQKLGTKEITREGFEYELTVNLEIINANHLVVASKDRTGLFTNKPEFVITKATGKKLIDWCNQGISVQKVIEQIDSTTTVEGLRHLYQTHVAIQNELKPHILKRKKELENLIEENSIITKKTPHNE